MKILELLNKVQIPITNEEADVLGQFNESAIIAKEDLDQRQIMIANSLVNKDILRRTNENGKIYFKKRT